MKGNSWGPSIKTSSAMFLSFLAKDAVLPLKPEAFWRKPCKHRILSFLGRSTPVLLHENWWDWEQEVHEKKNRCKICGINYRDVYNLHGELALLLVIYRQICTKMTLMIQIQTLPCPWCSWHKNAVSEGMHASSPSGIVSSGLLFSVDGIKPTTLPCFWHNSQT